MTQLELLAHVSKGATDLVTHYHLTTDDLTHAQLNWKPSAKKWSVAEVFAHLVLQEKPYPARIKAAVEQVQGSRTDKSFRSGPIGRYLIKVVSPEAKPISAPGMLVPKQSMYDRSIVGEWFSLQQAYQETLSLAEQRGVDLVQTRVPWVVTPLVRFRLGDLFLMQTAHKTRHLQQIQRVIAMPGFPAN